MTAREQLERTMRADQHVASRALAEHLHTRVQATVRSGMDRDMVYSALDSLYLQYRRRVQVVERDAVAEVLGAFDRLCSPGSSL